MRLYIYAILLLFVTSTSWSQSISHQNWQNQTIASDAITVECAPLLLPFELGRLIVENNPTTERGEMDKSLRSPHATKVSLQPETGSSDQITSITGCTTNGARVQLATVDTGDSITVVHTPGVIEFAGGGNVLLDSPLKILTLQRKAGIWVSDGGVGGGGSSGGAAEDLTTACATGRGIVSDGAGNMNCGGGIFAQSDCSTVITLGQICIDTDDGYIWAGDGAVAQRANPIRVAADCSPYANIGDLCIDSDDGTLWAGNEEGIYNVGAGGGGGSGSLDQAFDLGKIIDGANSEANAVVIGNGTDGFKIFVGTNGPTLKCFQGANTCDITLDIPTGNSYRLKYAGTEGIVINSSGAVTLNNALIEYRSFWFGAGTISVDGVNCTEPVERVVNSGPKMWVLQCADNNASVIYGSVVMPDSYSGGLVTFELSAYSEAAPPSGVLNFDFASMCRSDSDSINNSWPTGIDLREMAMTLDTQYDREDVTTSAQAPNGTCAPGDMLFWKATMDATATTTQVASTYILGVKMEYPANKWSDQ